MDNMYKIADQDVKDYLKEKYNLIREKTNLGGILSEKFNTEFEKIMEELREKDDSVRAIVYGQMIGNANPPADAISLKDLARSARTNFNRREYMRAISDLGKLHTNLALAVEILKSFNVNIDKAHSEFLFSGLDDSSKEYLKDLNKRLASSKSDVDDLVKIAGIFDFFVNVGTERGRALKIWEKKYPNKIKEFKKKVSSILDLTDRLVSIVFSALSKMGTARSKRDTGSYNAESLKIIGSYESYDKQFRSFYNSQVRQLVADQDFAPTPKPTVFKNEDGESTNISDVVPDNINNVAPEKEVVVAPSTKSNKVPETVRNTVDDPSLNQDKKIAPPISAESFPSTLPPSKNQVAPLSRIPLSSKDLEPLTPKPPGPKPPVTTRDQVAPTFLPSVKPSSRIPLSSKDLEPLTVGLTSKDLLPSPPVTTRDQVPPTFLPSKRDVQPETLEEIVPPTSANSIPPTFLPATSKQPNFDEIPPTMRSAYKKFFKELQKMSNEDPLMVKLYIKGFARVISNKDPSMSKKLLKIANSVG